MLSCAGVGEPTIGREPLVPQGITVPPDHNNETVLEAGLPQPARYRDAYRRGWWSCIETRARQEGCRNLAGSGWPSEAQGYTDGYLAADGRVEELLRQYDAYSVYRRLKEVLEQHRAGASERPTK